MGDIVPDQRVLRTDREGVAVIASDRPTADQSIVVGCGGSVFLDCAGGVQRFTADQDVLIEVGIGIDAGIDIVADTDVAELRRGELGIVADADVVIAVDDRGAADGNAISTGRAGTVADRNRGGIARAGALTDGDRGGGTGRRIADGDRIGCAGGGGLTDRDAVGAAGNAAIADGDRTRRRCG